MRLPTVTLLFLLGFAGSSIASDWTVTSARGGVVRLVDGRWQELAWGDPIEDNQAVRTLRRGAAELDLDGVMLALGDETTIVIDHSNGPAAPTVSQYSGQLAISVPPQQDFTLLTPGFYLSEGSGTILVTVNGKSSKVEILDGQTVIHRGGGEGVTLTAGDIAQVDDSSAVGLVVATAARNKKAASSAAGITGSDNSANASAAAAANNGNNGNSGNNGNNGNGGNGGSNSSGRGKSGK